MPHPTYFLQPCPTCGRRLKIRVEYLGRRMTCAHCRATFSATSGDGDSLSLSPRDEQVERLLAGGQTPAIAGTPRVELN